jgi:hypothetical protein
VMLPGHAMRLVGESEGTRVEQVKIRLFICIGERKIKCSLEDLPPCCVLEGYPGPMVAL